MQDFEEALEGLAFLKVGPSGPYIKCEMIIYA